MSAKSITFNSYSLQDSNFRTRDIVYRNMPEKVIDLEPNVRRDGFYIVNTYYSQKSITISGTLTRDTEANLKTTLDAMKEALNTNEANLDIGDGGGTMRFEATVESIDIPEEHYNITQVPYRITFRCQPFGKATSTTTDTKAIDENSDDPYTNTFNPTGSAPPSLVLKWTCDGNPTAAITAISFENVTTGETITVSGLVLDADGDYLEIDTDNMTVKYSVNGGAKTDIDFVGVFTSFVPGANSYSVTFTGGGATWDIEQTIVYYPSYF